jgi:hypothetical protein
VLSGDVVDETTMRRERLDAAERAELVRDARRALERMIAIAESAPARAGRADSAPAGG